jgi:hypothetical protein
MDLAEFVKSTIVAVLTAVNSAQAEVVELGAMVNPADAFGYSGNPILCSIAMYRGSPLMLANAPRLPLIK